MKRAPESATAILLLLLACLWATPAAAQPLRPVTLQLKWAHQFQFAGYYAAQERGFYRDEGLAVDFKEFRHGTSVEAEVLGSRADFGVSGSEALLHYQHGDPIVVLGVFFQHAASILLYRAGSTIIGPQDLKGRRIMLPVAEVPSLWAMFARHGIGREDIIIQQLTGNIADLIQGETDAMAAYLTTQPHTLAEAGVEVGIMRPADFGIDFCGDCLITSKKLADTSPEVADGFLRASIRGWEYAMAHPDALIELIRERYNPARSREALSHEASVIRELMIPGLVDIGTMNRSRWLRMAQACQEAGLIETLRPMDDFYHTPADQRRLDWVDQGKPYLMAAGAAVTLAILTLALVTRRQRQSIRARTRQLERNRESLRQVIDLVPNMVYAKDREGRFLLVNRAMADTLGSTVDQLTGAQESDVHPDDEQDRRRLAQDRMVFDSGYPAVTLEEPFRHQDGTMHWLQTTRLPYLSADTGEPAVLGLSIDITTRKLADEALRRSEERFRAIFNQTYQFTGILSPDGTVIEVNESSLEQLGQQAGEIIGKPFWEAHWFEHTPENRAWLKDAVRRAAKGDVVRREATGLRADGAPDPGLLLKPARDSEGAIVFLIPEGRDITALKQTEEELQRLNEELERRVANRTHNLEQAKEDLELLAELTRTQEELILSEKLAALGSLVAGVAHEINTPLGIGVTACSFLADRVAELDGLFSRGELKKSDLERFLEDGRESLVSTLTNLNRAAGLISSFKQVAADQSSEIPRQFNLRTYVDEVLSSLRPRYKHTGHTVENLCQDVELFSYPGAFVQIITNLLINALTHAYGPGDSGRIQIGGRLDGDMVVFTFSDDGAGIPESVRDRIFEPFVTTRRGTGGTGLGLHIVFNIVNKVLGGTIRFTTESGEGTSYTITIPREHAPRLETPENEP